MLNLRTQDPPQTMKTTRRPENFPVKRALECDLAAPRQSPPRSLLIKDAINLPVIAEDQSEEHPVIANNQPQFLTRNRVKPSWMQLESIADE